VQGGNVDENLILDGGTIPHFTEHLAKTILTDFEESWNGCEDLLIHCSAGTSRSPSVAIALNEIFDLGQNSNKLKRDYPNYSREIYWLLLSTHRRLNDPLGV